MQQTQSSAREKQNEILNATILAQSMNTPNKEM